MINRHVSWFAMRWRWWAGPTLVLFAIYFLGYYQARHRVHYLAFDAQGRFHGTNIVSLAHGKTLHRALVCLYFPFVLANAEEIGPTFGAKLANENYPSGSTFYLSGEEVNQD